MREEKRPLGRPESTGKNKNKTGVKEIG